MAWGQFIQTSIFGRRFGLQSVTTNISGSAVSGRTFDLLLGPEALKQYVSSSETTSTNLPPYGVSILTTGAGGSTCTLYKLDPPIPGVEKTIVIVSTNTATNMVYVQTSTAATICFTSTAGSTLCTISSSGGSQTAFKMVGVNSTQWGTVSPLTTAVYGLTTST